MEYLDKMFQKSIGLEIKDLTIYEDRKPKFKEASWKLNLKLEQSAILERTSEDINKEFDFKGRTCKII